MNYKKAAAHWTDKEAASKKLDQTVLVKEIESFIAAHNTCALATADLSGFVRATPIEYTYMNGCFWLLSEGGLKFKGLEVNKNVCLAIYDAYEGFGKLGGMQISAEAEMIEPWTEEYLELLEYKKIPEESLRSMPVEMHLIKIRPKAIDFLNSAFKEQGADSRQHLEIAEPADTGC